MTCIAHQDRSEGGLQACAKPADHEYSAYVGRNDTLLIVVSLCDEHAEMYRSGHQLQE